MTEEQYNVIVGKLDTINTNIEVGNNANIYLVVGIVVIAVCFLLYKVIDNFISF